MFKTIVGLVSFASAGKTQITIDDSVMSIPDQYAEWAAQEAQTPEGQAFAKEFGDLYKKASLKIALNHGKVLKPLNEELEIYLDHVTVNDDCKKWKLIQCFMDNDVDYFSGDGTWGECGKSSNCYIKFTKYSDEKLQKIREKHQANYDEFERAL